METKQKQFSSFKLIILILVLMIFGGVLFFIINDSADLPNNQTNEESITQTQIKYNTTEQDEIEQNSSETEQDQSLVSNSLVPFKDFEPNPVPAGSKGIYDLSFEMNEDGKFFVDAEIEVENLSKEGWSEIVFYFIPNVFTEGNEKYQELLQSYGYSIDDSAAAKINSIDVNHQPANYELEYDTLKIILKEPMLPKEKNLVRISYEFNVPKYGMRFKEDKGNYHLAQWYPMLANYDLGWDKNDYFPVPESYHTTFSDFKVSYNIPQGFTIFSSSENDPPSNSTSGEFNAYNVKEMFVTLQSSDMYIQTDHVLDIEFRVSAFPQHSKAVDEVMEKAKDALSYFHNHVGKYPLTQFDIILGENLSSMEYPGIVTVSSVDALVHEIAHQWFYGMINNDPSDESWLDEGFTTFATSYYFYDFWNYSELDSFSFPNRHLDYIVEQGISEPANVAVFENMDQKIFGLYYGLAPIKIWELLKENGMQDNATTFLKAYYDTYAYKQVSTEEFVRFAQSYFQMEDTSFFEEWLDF